MAGGGGEGAAGGGRAEHEEVVGVGGLYVLGTERHESRRIDNQLRGRSGRQGDPGESRFYLSLEDDLMRMFNADKVAHFMEWLKTPPDVPIESKAVTRSIRSAQTQVEQQNFEIRKDVLKYDDVLNRQRQVIYGERRTVLEGADLHEQIRAHDRRGGHRLCGRGDQPRASPRNGTSTSCGPRSGPVPPELTVGDLVEEAGGERSALSQEFIAEVVKTDAQDAYDRREAELTAEVMRELERRVVLAVLDHKWREHLYEMDYLREGIGLRAMAQRDPLVEYQREGYDMFNTMMEGIKEESVAYLFNSKVDVQQNPIVEEAGGELPAASPALGQVPGNVAPGGVIEDSVAPAGPAPVDGSAVDGAAVDGAPAQRSGRRGSGGRGSRGRHAMNGPAPPAAAQPPAISGRRPALPRGDPRAEPAAAARPAVLQRTDRGRRGTGSAPRRVRRRRGVRQGRPERPLPLRLRAQVQAVPRRSA